MWKSEDSRKIKKPPKWMANQITSVIWPSGICIIPHHPISDTPSRALAKKTKNTKRVNDPKWLKMTQNAKNAKRVCGEKVAKEWRTCGESRDILVVFVARLVVANKKTAPSWYAKKKREGVSTVGLYHMKRGCLHETSPVGTLHVWSMHPTERRILSFPTANRQPSFWHDLRTL